MNNQTWLDVFLVVEEDRFFARSKSGAIWGTIYFQIGDNQFFPGKGWTDLVAAFVAGWLEALLRVTTGTVESHRVSFLDGPYAVDISMPQKGLANLSFVHNEESKLFAVAELRHLRAHAVSVARELLSACQQKGWSNGDTEALASLIEQCSC
jgi:hypothetical protein